MKQRDLWPSGWSETEMAYFAGLFDGDGYVGIQVDSRDGNFLYAAHVTNTDPRPLVRLRELFGGGICPEHRKQYGCIWKWTIYGRRLDRFLAAIAPYLIIKKDQVDVFFRARQLTCRGAQRHSSESRRVLMAAVLGLKELKRQKFPELPTGGESVK